MNAANLAPRGCGGRTSFGHGDTAICGEPYYSGIYICSACELAALRADLSEALALLTEVLEKFEPMTISQDELVPRIQEFLKGKP